MFFLGSNACFDTHIDLFRHGHKSAINVIFVENAIYITFDRVDVMTSDYGIMTIWISKEVLRLKEC